jgi:membrane-associated phospholipid phosphatase
MNSVFASLSWPAIGLRVGIVAGALVAWFWTQSLIARKSSPKEGIGDVIHDLTARWHQYFSTNSRAANTALIISSIFIDLTGLALIGAAIFGPTFAPFLAILILFGLRQICQSLCTLPPPPGIIWRNPGFPALLVTYDVGNDFFFSGHTALAVLGALMAASLGPPWLAVLAATIALGEMLIVLVLRAHYTLDVVAGALAAFLAAGVAGKLSPVLDAWLQR